MTKKDPMTTQVTFPNITAIRRHKFYGCHAYDANAFDAIEHFVLFTDHKLAHRAEALRVMYYKGMGLDPRPIESDDEAIVAEYIRDVGTP